MDIRKEMQDAAFFRALAGGEFCVWYQPQVDMRTGRVCGAEALVRWERPDGNVVPPGQFIPALEESGQIIRLDWEVLRQVCRDLRDARERGIQIAPVSVNLSRAHMDQDRAADHVVKMMRSYKICAEELAFELTESVPHLYSGASLERLVGGLREAGVRVSMDDFGTGNSTLKILARIGFDCLKLDRYFVSRIGEARAEIILQSSIRLAETLGMRVVAEGVETDVQSEFLKKKGCYIAQGYYYFPPLRREEYFLLATVQKKPHSYQKSTRQETK